MSPLLLDTHIWLWYAEGVSSRLSAPAVRRLDTVRRDAGLLISAISVWEIGTHVAKDRIQLSAPLRDWVNRALDAPGIRFLPLDASIAAESTLLPGKPHGDPADRMLIASARLHNATLATRDRHIISYAEAGFVRVVEL